MKDRISSLRACKNLRDFVTGFYNYRVQKGGFMFGIVGRGGVQMVGSFRSGSPECVEN